MSKLIQLLHVKHDIDWKQIQNLIQNAEKLGIDLNELYEGTNVLMTLIDYDSVSTFKKRRLETIELLISKSVDINLPVAIRSRSIYRTLPLFVCVQKNFLDIMNLLIEADCDVNATTERESVWTDFFQRSHKQPHMFDFLLKIQCDINLQTTRGNKRTPLMLALRNECFGMAEKLLELGCDVNLKNSHGENEFFTAIDVWVSRPHDESCSSFAKLLIESNVDIHVINDNSDNAFRCLEYAGISEHSKNIVQFFLDHGWDVNKNPHFLVMHLSKEYLSMEDLQFLLQIPGLDVNTMVYPRENEYYGRLNFGKQPFPIFHAIIQTGSVQTIQAIVNSGVDLSPSFPGMIEVASDFGVDMEIFEMILQLHSPIGLDPFKMFRHSWNGEKFQMMIAYGAKYEDIDFSFLETDNIDIFNYGRYSSSNYEILFNLVEQKKQEIITSLFSFLPDSHDKIISSIVYHFLCKSNP